MPSGDSKPIKVPVAKNMLDSHLNGSLFEKGKSMLTIIIAEAEVCFFDNANRQAKGCVKDISTKWLRELCLIEDVEIKKITSCFIIDVCGVAYCFFFQGMRLSM